MIYSCNDMINSAAQYLDAGRSAVANESHTPVADRSGKRRPVRHSALRALAWSWTLPTSQRSCGTRGEV